MMMMTTTTTMRSSFLKKKLNLLAGSFSRTPSFSKSFSTTTPPKPTTTTFQWLDLRGSGLCMIERLSLEEALLRHTTHNWIIIGTHDVWPPKYYHKNIDLPEYITTTSDSTSTFPNTDCMVVMGIGGKPTKLLNIDNILKDQILVIKRFSGGGTVVMDHNSVWTTIIGRTSDLSDVEPYPRSIMEWSADTIFGPTFDKLNSQTSLLKNKNNNSNTSNNNNNNKMQKTLVMDTKSCSPSGNLSEVIEIPINRG